MPENVPARQFLQNLVDHFEAPANPALQYLQNELRNLLSGNPDGIRVSLPTADIFVDNLKTATPWMLKLVNVELLAAYVARGHRENLLHVAAHFPILSRPVKQLLSVTLLPRRF